MQKSLCKKVLVLGIILLMPTVGLSGCVKEKPVLENTGTIVYNDFEGGFYGIIADNLPFPIRHLNPINLPQEYREDGLRVWFKVQLRPDLPNFQLWGIMVEILEIHKIIE